MSRGRTKQCPLWSRERKGIQEWNEQKMPKVLPCYSGGRLPGREALKEAGGEEVGGKRRECRKKNQESKKWLMRIKEKAIDDQSRKRTVGQSVKQNWDCSQIENEEEDEEEDWQKEMGMQWAEDEKLEEILERRMIEGRSSLQAEVMQQVPELVVHERMSQGKEVTETKENKKVKGWSTEDMKDKPNSLLEEDIEEMRGWRGLDQDEMDQCWAELAERMEEVLDKYKVENSKRDACRGRGSSLEWRRVRRSRKYRMRK